MDSKKAAGNAGEAFAAACLEAAGYRIVARNFTIRQGELDLVAANAQYLIFAEVKTRRPGSLVSAEEAVDYHKQRRLRAAGEHYLMKHPSELQPRFDVLCVEHGADGKLKLTNWIEDAF